MSTNPLFVSSLRDAARRLGAIESLDEMIVDLAVAGGPLCLG